MLIRSRLRFIAGNAAAFATIGVVGAPARAAQYELKCGTNNALDHPSIRQMTAMWAAIEQESGGRIHTQFYPNSVLGSEDSMFTQVRAGALHFQMTTPGIIAAVVPVSDIAFVGFTFKDAAEGQRVFDGPLGAYIRQEAAAKGIYAMRTMWDTGMFQVGATTKAIRTPDDMRGFKPRVSGSRITLDFFRELGASPTPLALAETYAALQTKLVDGETSPLVNVEAAHWYEVLKYISLTNHAWGGMWVIANGDFWKSLPPDLQQIIERNNTKYGLQERIDTKALNAALATRFTQRGLLVNTVDQAPFRARLRNYYASWAGNFGPTAWGLLETAVGHKLT